jgi:hypothetical protein
MNSEHNQGIIVTGGTVTAHQLVAGSNARAESIVNGSQGTANDKTIDDLRTQLDALLVLIQDNKHCLAPDAEKAIEIVKQEAAKPEPSKFVISSVLDSVSGTVKSFASLTSAIAAVKDLVALLL